MRISDFKHTGLAAKITVLTTVVIFFSLSISAAFSILTEMKTIQNYSERVVLNLAKSLSKDRFVIEVLANKEGQNFNEYINEIRLSMEDIVFITVCDMDSIRYAHPTAEEVGKKFVGGDNQRVITKRESYVSVATGTLGKSLRAFAPVIDDEGFQIGFIAAGTLISNITEIKSQSLRFFILAFGISLLFGFSGSFALARNIKKTLSGLEPYEIIRLYNEKNGMLNAIHEGILAIDSRNRITMINESALKILNVAPETEKLIGKNIIELLPSTKLIDVMKTGQNHYNREDRINQTIVVANRIVLRDGEKITGAIASFQDKTKLTLLAEEITGVNQIISALRASNHEFKNKLHVILGFIHSGKYQNAENFILNIAEDHDQIVFAVTKKIKNATIAALLLGKLSRSRELNIDLQLDESTFLNENSYIYNRDLIIIIGNILENSFEAIQNYPESLKKVSLLIHQKSDEIKIMLKDTGIGIGEENIKHIFERGYTTKPGSEGVGLDLVKKSIENMNGKVSVISSLKQGSEFFISLKLRGTE